MSETLLSFSIVEELQVLGWLRKKLAVLEIFLIRFPYTQFTHQLLFYLNRF
jgi:hypothetical protein